MPDDKISSDEMADLFSLDSTEESQGQESSSAETATRVPADQVEEKQTSTQVSDDEMAALFGGEQAESTEPAELDEAMEERELSQTAHPDGVYVKLHDWSEKKRLSSEQIRTLNDIHDQFAKSYGPALSIPMKKQIEIKLAGEPEQITYGEFINGLPNPTSLNRFILPPLEGTAALQVDLALAFSIIDRLLGGTGEPVDADELRALTEIDVRVLQRALNPMLQILCEAWMRVYDIQPTFTTAESIPYYLQLSQMLDDIVIVAKFTVQVSDEFGPILDSSMSICYPYILLQPIASHLRVSQLFSGSKVAGSTRDIQATLEKVKVPAYCNLVRDHLRIQDLLEMEKGDVITFRTRLDQASEVIIGKTSVFWGRPGAVGRRHAVKIESFIDPDEHAPLRLARAEETDESSEGTTLASSDTAPTPGMPSMPSTAPLSATSEVVSGDAKEDDTSDHATDETADAEEFTPPPIRMPPIPGIDE